MRIAVVGSRTWVQKALLYETLDAIHVSLPTWERPQTFDLLVSGGANGADNMACHWAKDHKIPTRIYWPQYAEHGRSAPILRNIDIVENSDWLVAFWNGKSSGTVDALNKALKGHERCPLVILPDGREFFYTRPGMTEPEEE